MAKIGKGTFTSQTFSYHELCVATRNFHPENMIGEGGFGRVYKGRIKSIHQVALTHIYMNVCQERNTLEFLINSNLLMLCYFHAACCCEET